VRRRLRLLPRASDGGLSKPPSVAPDLGTDKHVYLLPEEYRQPPVPQSAEDREASRTDPQPRRIRAGMMWSLVVVVRWLWWFPIHLIPIRTIRPV